MSTSNRNTTSESERQPLLPNTTTTTNNVNAAPISLTKRTLSFLLFAGVIAIVVLGSFLVQTQAPKLDVSVERVISHLLNLERIAKEVGGGSRTVAQPGFKASVDYVVGTLRNETTLNVWTESLFVYDQVDTGVPTLRVHNQTYTARVDFQTATYSGSGTLSGLPLFIVRGSDPTRDLPPPTNDNSSFVALISQSSTRLPSPSPSQDLCSRVAFAISVLGAKAVLVSVSPVASGYPRPLAPSGRLPRTCTKDQIAVFNTVPIVSLSQQLSWDLTLRALDTPLVDLDVKTEWKEVEVWNVLAEPNKDFKGKNESIIIYGCHLDSVRAGPGINDDGSGAMATLELAVQYSKSLSKKSIQKVRFAWWAAEEIGLLGSIYHVEKLATENPELLAHYKLNIDTDMIGSPNYVRGVWDGKSVEDQRIQKAASVIQNVFEGYFKDRGLPTVPFKFNGRSDFAPFMARGIPAGGVITGEDEIKTAEQAELFGGVANMVLDPNYHQPADTVESLRGPGKIVLEQNLKALAHSVRVFALEQNIDAFLKGK
ncbi:UNVERIFIED_CONTAM: hypothetical protein HDU68_001212 [Siphonaria sp. JEL0065]|nr:hypothetical protein HDU68_001212 [Siphonaria sp. JEL0065]